MAPCDTDSNLNEQVVYKSYANGTIMYNASFIALFSFWAASYFIVIPVSINLIATSTLIIFLGCHRSLRLLDHDAIPLEEKETLSEKDAYKFPIIGSVSLFGLYSAFKYLDKDMVNIILACYFSLVGVFTLTSTFSPAVSVVIKGTSKYGFKRTVPVLGEVDATMTKAEIFCMFLSMIFCYFYVQTKHYILNNVLGISFCVQAIERVSLGSYKIGAILLIGLFFYDIFWVFGTDVMVTVAKSFDGPIKLLFPRVLPSLSSKGEFSLLGLGDIVVPGLFIALLIRYDATRATVAPVNAECKAFPKPYFMTSIAAYAFGLMSTVFVMYFFNSAQPALLYLVPMCLGASLSVAVVLKDLSGLYAYDEDAANTRAKKAKDALLGRNLIDGSSEAEVEDKKKK
mmetsp:Transcript_18696/g.27049  ORF Transcript_18696/g.27049 Transcript_18696/m.27049 type:complete len:398 (-) Transcript_18696:498-1691(-)|eukprot:CAMPEP_0185023686 /NCGR_PEP_ID=MMETSP1103-20130426/6337_1 /TAXON_ID=36769 /ORGANISM="Paraphysomonas bandaiensis, Strain Caron Lab Isolate" /LENGTH=397 /DNA_ID=CAMNT_0027556399 /DNA_START=50 /DNA_END=1243 /DNA_ORIENTATION=+